MVSAACGAEDFYKHFSFRVVGTEKINEKLTFIIKWKNAKDGKVYSITPKEIYEKWPNVAIDYLQARLFCTSPRDDKKTMG